MGNGLENFANMRVLIKGGVWKNTEDEILKAAVMKYGKNQWARISSLLTRKTAAQCKARWFEWLDPSIKKTEWSKEEDEKLLHLAKIMPTQWRTIAPVVGRTPAQCLERYQKLLDEAEGEQSITADDVRRLRPGEIDPTPETKPARPDPVDMDEDEKEMLSEARARLANTQGKKAKRRAREKQLTEARRLALLQKKRELKGLDIDPIVYRKDLYTGMDYNKDIPFQRVQPAGFWDINQERLREQVEKKDVVGSLVSDLEGKRRYDEEEIERKKDFKRQKLKEEKGEFKIPQALKEDAFQTTMRKGLILPAPQISEQDLDEIVKMGVNGETARSMVSGNETPTVLLGPDPFKAPTPQRTVRIVGETGDDAIKTMARNLKALTESQTPLLGEDIQMQGTVEFTPQKAIPSTPNALLNLKVFIINKDGPTPYRDTMGINTPKPGFNETPRQVRQELSSLFAQLPKPKNEFEIVLPQVEDVQDDQMDVVEDEEDVQKRKEREMAEEEQRKLNMRSQVVQLGLPRPVISLDMLQSMYCEGDTIEAMISREQALLMYRDATEFPVAGQKPFEFQSLDELDYADEADRLIQEELANIELLDRDLPPLTNIDLSTDTLVDEMTEEVHKRNYHFLLNDMKTKALKSQKLGKRMNITQGGYFQRQKNLVAQLTLLGNQIEQKREELELFREIKERETIFCEHRVQVERKELERLAMIEQDLQDRYRDLKYQHSQLTRK